MQKISKYRGIDKDVYKYIKEKREVTKFDLRQKFVAFGEGALTYSLNSLVHKKLITIEGAKVLLSEETRAKLTQVELLNTELKNIKAQNKLLIAGIEAVNHLISNSDGVQGLHLNGDTATWGELLEGGSFEAWLVDFSTAIKTIR